VSRLYDFTVQVYRLLEERAEANEYDELIFEGYYKRLVYRTGASSTYYSLIRQLLGSPANSPCITFMQKGNVAQPSRIRLHHPPPEEWSGLSQSDLTGVRGAATLIPDLEKRVAALEAVTQTLGEVNLKKILLDFERRLLRLESKPLEKERGTGKDGKA
jgi:hypothetical protein